jgi:hypothetical protein
MTRTSFGDGSDGVAMLSTRIPGGGAVAQAAASRKDSAAARIVAARSEDRFTARS